jgi:hypothetical protein
MPFCPRCKALMDAGEIVCPQCAHRLKEEVVYRADYEPQELLDLGLSAKFVEFVFLDPKPSKLGYWCESRHSGWACFIPKDVSGVYPLWTCNADVTALWMRRGRMEFVKLHHDDPEPSFLARTEQGLLLELFLSLLESEDWNDPAQSLGNLQHMAKIAGFRHLAELNEWHQRNGGANDFAERWDRFAKSLDKKQGEPGTAGHRPRD